MLSEEAVKIHQALVEENSPTGQTLKDVMTERRRQRAK